MSRIGMVQMTSGVDPARNAATVTAAAKDAAAQGAVMLFAPEMAGLLDRDRKRAAPHVVTEADNGYLAAIADAARDHSIWIHAGSVPVVEAGDSRWRNRSVVFDNHGNRRAYYDKIHLFDVDLPTGESWRESAAYAPGDRAVTVETPAGVLGLTICYDLRFPELFTALGMAGAQIVTVPAAFTVPTGEAHWHVLLRARAIELGAWIIAPAQCGTHEDGRATYGHSLVIDPWGTVIHDSASTPGLAVVDIALDQVNDVRGRIPALQHRRAFALPGATA